MNCFMILSLLSKQHRCPGGVFNLVKAGSWKMYMPKSGLVYIEKKQFIVQVVLFT
jgi:hypothetical protein